MNLPDFKDPLWRESVSRAAMIVLAAVPLAAAGGIFYAAWRTLKASSSGENGTVGFPVLVVAFGVILAWVGLFLVKRAVLPSRIDEKPPRVASGDHGPDTSWWELLTWWW